MCYGSLHQNKSFPFISQILTIRTPHAMHIEAKSIKCWKYSPEDPHALFLPGSNFTQIPMLSPWAYHSSTYFALNQNQNYLYQWKITRTTKTTLPKGLIGFSSLDVSDKDEPKYQIRDANELTNAILSQMNSTTIVSHYILQLPPNHMTSFCK